MPAMTLKRAALLMLALPALVLAAAAAWALLVFDPDSLRPRLVAEAERATGRAVAITGPLRLGLLSVSAERITVGNLPGGSRAEMLTLRRATAALDPWPLFRGQVVLSSLRLSGADVLFENANWVFAPVRGPATGAASAPRPPREPSLRLERLVLEDGRVTFAGQTLLVPRVVVTAGANGVLALDGELRLREQPLRLAATGGTLPQVLGDAPWPLAATVTAEGASLGFEGNVVRNGEASGLVSLRLDRLARLAPWVPRLALLPPMEAILVTARLGADRRLSDLRATIDSAALGAALLESITLTAAGAAAPLAGEGRLRLGQGSLAVVLAAGAPARFLPGAPEIDWPLRVSAQGEGLAISVESVLPAQGGQPTGTVSLRAADLGASGRRLGLPLPGLIGLVAGARLAPEAGGLRIAGLSIDSGQGDLAGDVLVQPASPLRVTAALTSRHLDLDAMRATLAGLSAPGPVLAPTAAPAPAPVPAAPAAPVVSPPLPRAAATARVIPDLPLPLAALARLPVTGDIALRGAEVILDSVTYRDLDLRLALAPGQALLDPLAMTIPGGRLALRVEATPARLALRVRTDALDTATFETAYGLTRRLSGALEIDAELAGPGADLREFLAGATGHLGLAMLGGQLEPASVAGLPPQLVGLLLPGGLPRDGVALRCSALWLRAEGGVATVQTLLVDGALGRIGGTGTINLGDEALALRLLPDLRVGGVSVRAPVSLVGSLGNPRIGQVDARGAAAGALGALLSLQRTPDRRLSALAQDLGANGPPLPDCAPALTAARAGREGAVPPPREPDAAPPTTPGDLLRGLFGR